ncbi:hypothetical protein BJP08_10160 [Corynebacterium sp. NML140438]|uniref:5-methylcytosine restriction system specificity protein McrC n=1 Tax=Corynebacterium sp. NML140438 TaxID=1906334 RepID=UPI0008FB3486|nr:hypothetical protein [Corynebacterium sp. NML140438]OIR40835.1 hypothetical protein BJP08_10160 [Corynebacterium sp. NML140438]
MTPIPVRNVWLLQLLASKLYRDGGVTLSGAELVDKDVIELVSTILADAAQHRLRNGLRVGFERHTADIRRVRGKIDLLGTARDQLLTRGRIRCTFDEVSFDTPTNRLVRSALIRATRFPDADPRCHHLADQFGAAGVSALKPDGRAVAALEHDRNASADLRMIAAAKLIHDLAVPNTQAGSLRTLSLNIDDHHLRRLFEAAALGAYTANLPTWDIKGGKHLRWDLSSTVDDDAALLPGMITDIILRPPGAPPIILDTKFTEILQPTQYHAGKFRSNYLYQIYAYVMSQQANPGFGPHTRGVLLHPVIGKAVNETVVIQGHPFRFATVDLHGTYREIIAGFLGAVEGL